MGESKENLRLMATMDRLFTQDPTLGVLGMQDELADMGIHYNIKRIRRLLRIMGFEPLYPKKNLSSLGHAKYVHPYLLRHLEITRPNQVWAIDITYIPMKCGRMYLTATIEFYIRFIVSWQLSNSLQKENRTTLLQQIIAIYGRPEIINSDQGSQYTCANWVETLQELDIHISMDGKGRTTDHAIIERWFRTLKQKYYSIESERLWTNTTSEDTRELTEKNQWNCITMQRQFKRNLNWWSNKWRVLHRVLYLSDHAITQSH